MTAEEACESIYQVWSEFYELEKRILAEQVGDEFQLVEYRPTWPEYLGYVLAGMFVLSCFWFLFTGRLSRTQVFL